MTSVDKAAIAWTIAIVAIGVGFAGTASQGGIQVESGSPTTPVAPTMEESTTTVTKTKIPGYDRLQSIQDPGIGHETHQLAVILPPSDKVYSGTLRYDASEQIQLVSLVGPLGLGEDKGQPIWTPDGKTKFALTFVEPKNSRGEWNFVGNALAVHTMKTTPFIVDYKVTYDELEESDTVMTGTIGSIRDPGLGHNTHSLAIIIPPSKDVYSGTVSYSASENIQLVTLQGPLPAGKISPSTWTPDGKTLFALTLVDPKNQMGVWEFSGNALALHTMNTKGFTTSYAVSSEKISSVPVSTKTPTMEPQTVEISIPQGTSTPGCDQTNECFLPSSVSIKVGDTVVWNNDDAAAHTVTSGDLSTDPNNVGSDFDSSIIMSSNSFEVTFDKVGIYDYFCMVHPWMTGNVNVS